MPSKTPSISQFFLFIAGMFSIHSANAAAPRTLDECKQAYFSAVMVPVAQRETPTVQSQLKAWCTTQCVDEKINLYATQQNKPVTEALRAELTPSYQPACLAQYSGASSSNVATTPAGTGAGTGAGTASTTPSQCVLPAGQQQLTPAQNSACQQALEQQRQAALLAQQQQQQQNTGAQQPTNSQQQTAAVVAPLLNAATRGLQGGDSGSSAGTGGSSGGSTGTYATTPFGSSAGAVAPPPTEAVSPTPEQNQQAIAENTQEMQSLESRLPESLQSQGERASAEIQRDENGENPTPPTRITQAANQGSSNTARRANEVITRLRQLLCQPIPVPPGASLTLPPGTTTPPGSVNFSRTLGAFEKFLGDGTRDANDGCRPAASAASAAPGNTAPSGSSSGGGGRAPACAEPAESNSAVQKLNARRDCQCARATESAERLCVESEGMKGLRTVMDLAGPLLLGMNAAAKTCGGMADVSKFVGAGLTVANGLCIREKMKCESTCGRVIEQFTADYSKFQSSRDSAFQAERSNAIAACQKWQELSATDPTATAKYSACQSLITQIGQNLPTASTVAGEINAGERNSANSGTVPNMSALCKAKQRNIIGLATNIGAILLAAKNSKKCEKELAARGAGDIGGIANVTGAEYCSNEATRDSQFCKCQSSPSTEGCGQVLAAGPPSENTVQDQRGVNLQNGRGPSGFAGAGGGSGSGSSGGYRGYGVGEDGTGTAQSNLGSISSTMGGAGAPAMGLAAGGGPGGSGSASASSSDAKAAAKKEDDKAKWSFGSIASSIGGSLGFGGGSRNGDNGSNFKDDQRERIERKLASDRLAAEISPSTGADNFSKVKRSYVQKADTFMAP